jgi:hypothetical protein
VLCIRLETRDAGVVSVGFGPWLSRRHVRRRDAPTKRRPPSLGSQQQRFAALFDRDSFEIETTFSAASQPESGSGAPRSDGRRQSPPVYTVRSGDAERSSTFDAERDEAQRCAASAPHVGVAPLHARLGRSGSTAPIRLMRGRKRIHPMHGRACIVFRYLCYGYIATVRMRTLAGEFRQKKPCPPKGMQGSRSSAGMHIRAV